MGLKTKQVLSDNGYIGGEYCHEFVVDSPIGETTYLETEDGGYRAHEDVAVFYREPVNPDEVEKELQVIEQPEWVQTMEDNVKHYGLPASRYLKNVVYRNRTTGEIIIAVIRGDLDVNKVKLEKVVGAVGQLDDATDEDLAEIGTKSGWVHSWGHTGARYIGDVSLTTVKNFIGGQKEQSTDTINVNYGRDFECETLADIALAKEGYLYTENGDKLIEKRGIEVGNIFQLGHHYSSLMNAKFVDSDGVEKEYYMGCYGIGLGRTLAAIAEVYNDENGLMWPDVVAPYQIHLVSLNGGEGEAESLYNSLQDKGVEVLWDDREDVSAGEKFADADLIGIPIRVVVSERSLASGGYEVKRRGVDTSQIVKSDELMSLL